MDNYKAKREWGKCDDEQHKFNNCPHAKVREGNCGVIHLLKYIGEEKVPFTEHINKNM